MMKTTTVTVIKPFNCSDDGVHVRALAVGDIAEIRSDMVADLVAGGYVTEGEATKARKAAKRAKA